MTDWINFSCSFYYSISTDSHTNNNSQREDNIVLLSRRHSSRHSSVPHRIPRWNWEEYQVVVDFRRLMQVESLVDVCHRHACLVKRRIREEINCRLVPYLSLLDPNLWSLHRRRDEIWIWRGKARSMKDLRLKRCLTYGLPFVHESKGAPLPTNRPV